MSRFLPNLSRRAWIMAGAGAVLGVVVIAILAVVLINDAPPPATIESAVESVRADLAQSQQQQQNAPQQSQEAEPDESPANQTQEQQEVEAEAQADDSDGVAAGTSQTADDEQQSQQVAQQQQETVAQESADAEEEDAAQELTVAELPALTDLAGAWTLSETGQSFVGYRIGEELANIGTTTAVGRTNDIVATLEFDGAEITSVEIEADLRTLRSDEGFRDSALRTRGLESDTYPFARFRLTAPIAIDALPGADTPFRTTVSGELTLHGVTNPVEIMLDGSFVNGLVVVVGSVDIALADYEIEPPTGFRVLSIEDVGLVEFQIVFERGG